MNIINLNQVYILTDKWVLIRLAMPTLDLVAFFERGLHVISIYVGGKRYRYTMFVRAYVRIDAARYSHSRGVREPKNLRDPRNSLSFRENPVHSESTDIYCTVCSTVLRKLDVRRNV